MSICFFNTLFQVLLDKDGYVTPTLMQKACKNQQFMILKEMFKYCEAKKDYIEGKWNNIMAPNYLSISFAVKVCL